MDMLQLQLGASLWPLNFNSSSSSSSAAASVLSGSHPQQQLQCTLNVRKIGERAALQVPEACSSSSSSATDSAKKRVEVVVEVRELSLYAASCARST
jgi:hypothetical protein